MPRSPSPGARHAIVAEHAPLSQVDDLARGSARALDFDSAVVAPAPVAEEPVEAVAAYEAAEAAEPLRVEGAVDAVVEEEAMAMGRAVSMAEDAM